MSAGLLQNGLTYQADTSKVDQGRRATTKARTNAINLVFSPNIQTGNIAGGSKTDSASTVSPEQAAGVGAGDLAALAQKFSSNPWVLVVVAVVVLLLVFRKSV